MKVEVKKPFKIATDAIGITNKQLNEGDIAEINDKTAEGLIAEGYCVEVVEQKKAPASPENKVVKEAPKNKRTKSKNQDAK